MRLWMDDEGTLLTDDQVLRTVATFGSLEAACEHSNIRLVEDETTNGKSHPWQQSRPKTTRKLTDYLPHEGK